MQLKTQKIYAYLFEPNEMTLLSENSSSSLDVQEKRPSSAGVFKKCDGCQVTLLAEIFEHAFEVCPECDYHHRLHPLGWRQLLLDDATLTTWSAPLQPLDPLDFNDQQSYLERIVKTQKKTQFDEAIEIGAAHIENIPIAYGAFIFAFMGGSMGSVVGEKIAQLFEYAKEHSLPVVLLSASGGARMQEGILSLMQMAKTTAAFGRFQEAHRPFISVCLNPTTGGVAASFALLGDINIAEPRALIGFAGPRVIETTIRQKLPPEFQRAEYLLEHGMLDRVVHRHRMRTEIATLLKHML